MDDINNYIINYINSYINNRNKKLTNLEDKQMKEIIIKQCETTSKWDVTIDGERVGKHYNLTEATNNLYHYLDDFTETDLKRYLELKGYNYEKFQEYMRGQTTGINSDDGGVLYYNDDVRRYREG